MLHLPPSMHSSNQKYLRLWPSQGLPTKAPHISAICRISPLSISLISFSRIFWMKKSFRLSLGRILEDDSLLYLNASEMIPQTNSDTSLAFWLSNNFPASSKTLAPSPVEHTTVFVSLARSRMGLCSVPCIQLGPLGH